MRLIAMKAPRIADKGSAGAHCRNEVRHHAARLAHDLHGGAVEMRAPVGGIVVLIGVKVPVRIGVVNFAAKLLVDASGSRGFLFQRLGLKEERFPTLPDTCSLFAHFRDVRRTADLPEYQSTEVPPYAPDDAAVHHVFDGGWIWVLRFNNGLTSAGVALTPEGAKGMDLSNGTQAWTRILDSVPSVRRQFEGSQAVTPFVHQPHMPFLCSPMCGPGWILLPSAAGFVDPLFSSGFPLVLLGLHRLMRTLRTQWNTPTLDAGLEACASQTRADVLRAARLVGGIYQTLPDPEKLFSLARLYFAAVILTETARKLGRPELCAVA